MVCASTRAHFCSSAANSPSSLRSNRRETSSLHEARLISAAASSTAHPLIRSPFVLMQSAGGAWKELTLKDQLVPQRRSAKIDQSLLTGQQSILHADPHQAVATNKFLDDCLESETHSGARSGSRAGSLTSHATPCRWLTPLLRSAVFLAPLLVQSTMCRSRSVRRNFCLTASRAYCSSM